MNIMEVAQNIRRQAGILRFGKELEKVKTPYSK